MVTDKRISDAELDLMEVLWAAPEALTSTEVAEGLKGRGWSLATVKTMLSRLVAKGAISHREDGRRFLYSPAIQREAYVGHESKRFVERLFGGRLSPLVARLAEEDALDAKDIAEMEALLKELKS
jgi:BlaI family penicillinase repressor